MVPLIMLSEAVVERSLTLYVVQVYDVLCPINGGHFGDFTVESAKNMKVRKKIEYWNYA